jgi:hypothetical protein
LGKCKKLYKLYLYGAILDRESPPPKGCRDGNGIGQKNAALPVNAHSSILSCKIK